jgi:hypothetical protein
MALLDDSAEDLHKDHLKLSSLGSQRQPPSKLVLHRLHIGEIRRLVSHEVCSPPPLRQQRGAWQVEQRVDCIS